MKTSYLKTKNVVLLWNLSAIEADIDACRFAFRIKRIPLVNLVGLFRVENEEWMRANIGIPPLVASLAKDKYCVLFGGEQIEKARALGFKHLDCYFLTPSQHKKYILDYNEERYQRAVSEYWEDEV